MIIDEEIFRKYTRYQYISKMNNTNISINSFNYTNTPVHSFIMTVISFIGICLNLFVIIFNLCNPRLKYLPLNQFIISLSMADIVNSLSLSYSFAFRIISEKNFTSIPEGIVDIICKSTSYTIGTSKTVSVLTLLAISVERYRVIVHPFSKQLTKTHMKIIITLIWVVSLSATVLLLIGNKYEHLVALDCSGLLSRNSSGITNALCVLVYTFVFNILPVIIIAILYFLIILTIYHNVPPIEDSLSRNEILKARKRKNKVISAWLAITVLFTVCCIPFAVTYTWLLFYKISDFRKLMLLPSSFWTYLLISTYLTIISSLSNPFLYYFASPSFKAEIKRLLLSCSSKSSGSF